MPVPAKRHVAGLPGKPSLKWRQAANTPMQRDGTHDAGTAILSGRQYTWKTVPLPGRTQDYVITAEGIDSLGSVESIEV